MTAVVDLCTSVRLTASWSILDVVSLAVAEPTSRTLGP